MDVDSGARLEREVVARRPPDEELCVRCDAHARNPYAHAGHAIVERQIGVAPRVDHQTQQA